MLDYINPVNDVGAEDMADDSSAQKVDPSLVAEIVSSYVAQNSIDVDQLAGLIVTVHRTLSGLGTNAPAPVAEALTPAVPIRRSVQPDHVVCLECGFRGISHPLEVDSRLPDYRTSLFGAAFDDGKGPRAWSQRAGSRRCTTGS
jgi:ROS/MUCR transcriptional regulator protein